MMRKRCVQQHSELDLQDIDFTVLGEVPAHATRLPLPLLGPRLWTSVVLLNVPNRS